MLRLALEDGFLVKTQERQVCWTDTMCEDLGSMGMSVQPETMPQPWVSCPMPRRKVLDPEARRRTLQQKTYSFMVTTAILPS